MSARIRALLRRGKPHDTTLRVADLELNTHRRKVTRAGRTIDLKPKEYALLEFLVQNCDRPVLALTSSSTCGTSGSRTEFQSWLILIEAEYREMPGLHLTERQAQRLWGLDTQTCSDLLSTLVSMGVL